MEALPGSLWGCGQADQVHIREYSARKRLDGLRELVTRYMAYKTPQIAGSEPCPSVVEDGGPVARYLLSRVLEKGPQ